MNKLVRIENLIGVMLISFLFPVYIKVGFTNSGVLKVYFAQILYLFMWGFFAFKLFQKGYWKEKTVILYLAICVSYCIVEVYRLVTGGYFYHSVEMAFWTLVPVAFFILLLKGDLDIYRVCANLYYSIAFIFLYLIVNQLFVLRQLRTDFLGNINLLVFFCIAGIFIACFYYLNYGKNKFDTYIYVLIMVYAFFVIMLSGSRAGVISGLSAYCVLSLFLLKNSKFRKTFVIIISLGVAIVTLFVKMDIQGSRYYFERGFNLSTIRTSLAESRSIYNVAGNFDIGEGGQSMEGGQEVSRNIDDLMKEASVRGDANAVLVLNDIGRIVMWGNAVNEIRKDPLFGTGKVGVYKTGDGYQMAHNFFLEYWLAFGGIGMLLWVCFMVHVLVMMYKTTRSNKRIFIFMLLFLFSVFLFSSVEPTLSNTFCTLMVWSALGIFLVYSQDKNKVD